MNTLDENPSRPPSPLDRTRRPLTNGPLVVVAGIPGSGKSTALAKLAAHRQTDLAATSTLRCPDGEDLVVLDSAAVRHWLSARLPRVPYPLLRPVVHATHWARILVLALTEPRPLVIHETATRPLARRALRILARCGRRPARLVWIDVPAPIALEGQIDRCRIVRPHAFARHLHHVEEEHPATAARRTWDAVHVTDRDRAAETIAACATGPRRPPHPGS